MCGGETSDMHKNISWGRGGHGAQTNLCLVVFEPQKGEGPLEADPEKWLKCFIIVALSSLKQKAQG